VDGDYEAVKAALSDGEDVNGCDAVGRTCLMGAVGSRGRAALVDLLLDQPGLRLDFRDRSGWTAFHYACHAGNPAALRRLLAHPARGCPDTKDERGRSPLLVAVLRSSLDCARQLVAVAGVHLGARHQGAGLEEMAR
jgi:ankyrin repeat protein